MDITVRYHVGGSLSANDPSYVVRQADADLYDALSVGEFCYVFNSRQMGKSSLRVRVKHQLEQVGYHCASIDLTNIGSQDVSAENWYVGLIAEIARSLRIVSYMELIQWLQRHEALSPVQRFSRFLDELLSIHCPQNSIIIFIDEIDSVLSLPFAVDDFFALIRSCYNQRSERPEYHRLTFALFGVATPSALIRDRHKTPFNIGKPIELKGFQPHEIIPLEQGFVGYIDHPQPMIKAILDWTGGQPFLTQKLCQLTIQWVQSPSLGSSNGDSTVSHNGTATSAISRRGTSSGQPLSPNQVIGEIVKTQIIQNWEIKDEPEHLRTIRDRLLQDEANVCNLLSLYQSIWQQGKLDPLDTPIQTDLLLSGLVRKQAGQLVIHNLIYAAVFNLTWVTQHLIRQRPYGEALSHWLASQGQDTSCLLRGRVLEEAQQWVAHNGHVVGDQDYRFLAASQLQDKQELKQQLERDRQQAIAQQMEAESLQRSSHQQSASWPILFWSMITTALIGFLVVFGWSYHNQQSLAVIDVHTHTMASSALLASEQIPESLFTAMQAIHHLKRLNQGTPDNKPLGRDAERALRQAIVMAIAPSTTTVDGLDSTKSSWHLTQWPPEDASLRSASWTQPLGLNQRQGEIARGARGDRRVSVGPDNTVLIWHGDGTVQQSIPVDSKITHLAWCDSDPAQTTVALFASAHADQTIRIWRMDGTLLVRLNAHPQPLQDLVFTGDRHLLAIYDNQTLQSWNIATFMNTETLLTYACQWFYDHKMHPQSHILPYYAGWAKDKRACLSMPS